jgi:hypothetical protein
VQPLERKNVIATDIASGALSAMQQNLHQETSGTGTTGWLCLILGGHLPLSHYQQQTSKVCATPQVHQQQQQGR